MSRTTVSLDDMLLRKLKARAAGEGRTLSELISDLVRRAMGAEEGPAYSMDWEPKPLHVRPGVDINDRDKLFDLMDGR